MSSSGFTALVLVVLVTLTAGVTAVELGDMSALANDTCPFLLVAAHYQEMACEIGQIRNSTFMYCPRNYNCTALALRPKTQCLYKGRKYDVGEKLPSSALRVRCKHTCMCQLNGDGFAAFVCQSRKCAAVKPDCRQTYANPMQCCPKAKCDAPKIDEATCQYKNKTFTAGEIMDNTFNSTRCICRKGFKGEMTAPFCQPTDCGVELDYANFMRKGCSPVFSVDIVHIEVGKDFLASILIFLRERLQDLCPIRWACPSDDDVVVPLTSMAPDIPTIDSELTCRFGNNDMAMLDMSMSAQLEDGSCTMCICVVPPNLLCIHKTVCWAF